MVLSQHGHCAEEQCYVLFQEPKDFTSAEKRCKDTEGQLSTGSSKHFDKIFKGLPSGASGSYWLDLHRATKTDQNCSSIAVSVGRNFTVSWEPCGKQLSGFLCQYTLGGEACDGLKAGGAAQVKYTAHTGFEVRDSKRFPKGTIAVVGKVGSKDPDSKHVCFSQMWIQAPWFCEVFGGGCEHGCEKSTCLCPAGQTLLPNKITCGPAADPCAKCAHECQREGDTYACKCRKGYRLAADGKSCVDVNECAEENPCTGEGEECVNTQGGFQCGCKDDFDREDGVCVDLSICHKCEHLLCVKINKVYTCQCRAGHRVSKKNPTKCDMHCTERECPAKCTLIKDESKNTTRLDCFCPDGYIRDGADSAGGTEMCIDIDECESGLCDHKCENFYGGFRCGCNEGFELRDEYTCVPSQEETTEKVNGSSSGPPLPTAASSHPATLPSYIKTGSALGITLFVVMCVMLLLFLLHQAFKRCRKFTLSSIKHQNIDIFYLQQVTTETYKRLSFDKQSKSDS
ncbi:Thrombomodulin [Nibea albiflora]|uniref:Thrombomodulin n=1 Tax=Nibea albiflora TaxID=240163 RepID=A0ACB7F9E6_NIBAL|nr:Thrombomodulin [Nibea albiflora]